MALTPFQVYRRAPDGTFIQFDNGKAADPVAAVTKLTTGLSTPPTAGELFIVRDPATDTLTGVRFVSQTQTVTTLVPNLAVDWQ